MTTGGASASSAIIYTVPPTAMHNVAAKNKTDTCHYDCGYQLNKLFFFW